LRIRSVQLRSTNSAAATPTVKKDGADHRFADIAQHRVAQPRSGSRADRSELDGLIQSERFRNIGAGLTPHQISESFGQFALVGLRKCPIEHVRDDQTEHMIAEKFEPLIAVGAAARGLRRTHA
jgi:hypothetical protein